MGRKPGIRKRNDEPDLPRHPISADRRWVCAIPYEGSMLVSANELKSAEENYKIVPIWVKLKQKKAEFRPINQE
jgi:hypothetical protein